MNSRKSVTETTSKAIQEVNIVMHKFEELNMQMPEKSWKMVANNYLLRKISYRISLLLRAKGSMRLQKEHLDLHNESCNVYKDSQPDEDIKQEDMRVNQVDDSQAIFYQKINDFHS